MLKTKIAGLDKLIRKKAMDIGVASQFISGDREVIDVAVPVNWRDCLDPVRRIGRIPCEKVWPA